jgi:hypothetical protein
MKLVWFAVVLLFGVLMALDLHATYAKRAREKAIERGQRRLEETIFEAFADTERKLTRPMAPGATAMDDLHEALAMCDAIERELRALDPLPESTEPTIRIVHALRLSIAANRAGNGPESDRLRQQAAEILKTPGSDLPHGGEDVTKGRPS